MLWLFAVLLICAILSPRFRRFLLITAAVFAALVVGAIVREEFKEPKEQSK
jgi:hypothetical protein